MDHICRLSLIINKHSHQTTKPPISTKHQNTYPTMLSCWVNPTSQWKNHDWWGLLCKQALTTVACCPSCLHGFSQPFSWKSTTKTMDNPQFGLFGLLRQIWLSGKLPALFWSGFPWHTDGCEIPISWWVVYPTIYSWLVVYLPSEKYELVSWDEFVSWDDFPFPTVSGVRHSKFYGSSHHQPDRVSTCFNITMENHHFQWVIQL